MRGRLAIAIWTMPIALVMLVAGIQACTTASETAPFPTSLSGPTPVPTMAGDVVTTAIPSAPPVLNPADTLASSRPFSLGVPAGDGYDPSSIAVDAARGLAYVYVTVTATGGPAISVVDLAAGAVERLIPLSGAGLSQRGRLLLSPDGERVYVINQDARRLTLLDPHTGLPGVTVEDVQNGALSVDGEVLYVLGERTLRALAADALAQGRVRTLWGGEVPAPAQIAVSDRFVGVTTRGPEEKLYTFDAETGAYQDAVSLPDYPDGFAAGPDGGWAVHVAASPPVLLRFSADLALLAEAKTPFGSGFFYDEVRERYLVAGMRADGSTDRIIQALAAVDLAETTVSDWSEPPVPGIFAAVGEVMLLGLPRYGGDHLIYLDPATLAPGNRVILGVRLEDMALDAANDILYVADDQGSIHLLDLPSGIQRAAWSGSAPIALDTINGRLYVNRERRVVALDALSGAELARFPQGGVPAAAPRAHRVYIAQAGVTVYDEAGAVLGQLEHTFPVRNGFSPNPYAFSARVNPVSGYLNVIMNNGVPGSNNRSYVLLYPPDADEPISVPGSFSFLADMAISPTDGAQYVSYSAAMGLEALQVLDRTGHEIRRLGGRTGRLALDVDANRLYVVQPGVVARFVADTLTLDALLQLPGFGATDPVLEGGDLARRSSPVDQVALHPGLNQLYVRAEGRSEIGVVDPTALLPLDMTPRAVPALSAEADIIKLQIVEDGRDLVFYATASDGAHYRARTQRSVRATSLHWEQLPVGSLPVWGQLTVAEDGTLFHTGQGGLGADGVLRSTDDGDTWALQVAGLVDLRALGPVVARSADEAYFVGKTGGIFSWQADAGRWERIIAPESDYGWPGELALAPDGTLFLQKYERLRRSSDGGVSWLELPVSLGYGSIVGFARDYARTPTLFWVTCEGDICRVMRSDDGGVSARLAFTADTYIYDAMLLRHDDTLYLFGSASPVPRLFRSVDAGSAWQAADPASLEGVKTAALDPSGLLWLGLKGRVQSLDPGDLAWSDLPQAEPPSQTPTPDASSDRSVMSIEPVAALCDPPLTDQEAALVQRVPELGCPLSPALPLILAHQSFQNGLMIWQSDAQIIWVLAGDGRWSDYPDYWTQEEPELDPNIVPPEGLLQPVRGFGKVWREQLGGPAAEIGWATGAEQGVSGGQQEWAGGRVFQIDDGQFVVLQSGLWQRLP